MSESLKEWRRTGVHSEITNGEMFSVQIEGHQIAIYKVGGEIYATDNICTHAYAVLTDGWLDGAIVECPLHGGRFNVVTGEALGDPVTCDLRTYQTRARNGGIEVLI